LFDPQHWASKQHIGLGASAGGKAEKGRTMDEAQGCQEYIESIRQGVHRCGRSAILGFNSDGVYGYYCEDHDVEQLR